MLSVKSKETESSHVNNDRRVTKLIDSGQFIHVGILKRHVAITRGGVSVSWFDLKRCRLRRTRCFPPSDRPVTEMTAFSRYL